MEIFFEDNSLEELYLHGYTLDKKYKRLQKSIIKAYVKTVNYLRAVNKVEDLYRINSLHYEKKEGNMKGQEYVRINDKYRLRFHSHISQDSIAVCISLIEISKHYE